MTIGFNIKRLRSEKGITQGELADLSKLGLNMVSKLERDATDPKLSSLYKIMSSLECTPNELLINEKMSNLPTRLQHEFKRASSMPEDDLEGLIMLIDKYCTAVAYELVLFDKFTKERASNAE